MGTGEDFREEVRAIDLPLREEGAYLVMVRGESLYASGIVLVTPLELEVLEEPEAGRVRVTVRDARMRKPQSLDQNLKSQNSDNQMRQIDRLQLRYEQGGPGGRRPGRIPRRPAPRAALLSQGARRAITVTTRPAGLNRSASHIAPPRSTAWLRRGPHLDAIRRRTARAACHPSSGSISVAL